MLVHAHSDDRHGEHEHADHGYHAHLLGDLIDTHRVGAGAAWHAREHAHSEPRSDGAPAAPPKYGASEDSLSLGVPDGLLIETPTDSLGAMLRAASGLAFVSPRLNWGAASVTTSLRPPRVSASPAARLQVRRQRTGIALVLSASRALRI